MPIFRFRADVARVSNIGTTTAADGYGFAFDAPRMKPRAGLSPSLLAATGLRSASIWRTRKSRSRTASGGGKVSARPRSRAARGDFFGAAGKRAYALCAKKNKESAMNRERSRRCLVAYLEAARRRAPRGGR